MFESIELKANEASLVLALFSGDENGRQKKSYERENEARR
jgi:hypothetical protein